MVTLLINDDKENDSSCQEPQVKKLKVSGLSYSSTFTLIPELDPAVIIFYKIMST